MKVLVTIYFHVKKQRERIIQKIQIQLKVKHLANTGTQVNLQGSGGGQRDTEKEGGKERRRTEGNKRRERKEGGRGWKDCSKQSRKV